MAIPLQISPKIIPSIASLYNDPNRIFMEYIDNALDSAEELFDPASNGYIRQVLIEVKFIGSKYNEGVVIIKDNCIGITNFSKVVKSIGDSDKKGQFTTNGQFGYGIYSFMAANDKLEIVSKLKNKDALFLPILRSQFNASKQEDVSFPDPKKVSFKGVSGTEIRLSKFTKASWKQVDIEMLKEEIEKHFELLLSRKNLEIRIVPQTGKAVKCLPFDYDSVEGEVYLENIKSLETTTGRRVSIPVYSATSKLVI